MNNTALAPAPTGGDLIESVIVKGDLSKLTPQERTRYYTEVCKSVGLNPLTQPFAYITLNSKLTLYALRNCTDQLRTIHGVSVEDLTESEREGVFIVTAKVRNREGRSDVAKGAVTISGLKGDALANAMMKAETKAKRRATLSICGLGFLDESEIDTIPAAAPMRDTTPAPRALAPVQVEPPYDPETGEIGPHLIPLAMTDAGGMNYLAWGQSFIAGIKSATTEVEWTQWQSRNAQFLAEIEDRAPKVHRSVMGAIAATKAKFPEPEMLTEAETEDVFRGK